MSGPFFSEGRACHVRCATFDDQFPLPGHDKRAPPVLFLGGTRLSGPPFNARSSIPFYRGLKSRVKSGAKAPHSMECGDLSWSAAIYRRFSVKALAFTNLAVDPDGNEVLVGVEPDPAIRAADRRVYDVQS